MRQGLERIPFRPISIALNGIYVFSFALFHPPAFLG